MKPLQTRHSGLKTVALYEAFKGILVLLAGCGFLLLLHQDVQAIGENLIEHLHLNPAHHDPQIFLKALSDLQNMNVLLLALGATAYSTLRFVEAYGLWKERVWAEWLAVVSTGLYLPIEFYELWEKVSALKVAITVLNLALFLYLLKIRRENLRASDYIRFRRAISILASFKAD